MTQVSGVVHCEDRKSVSSLQIVSVENCFAGETAFAENGIRWDKFVGKIT